MEPKALNQNNKNKNSYANNEPKKKSYVNDNQHVSKLKI